LPAQSESEDGEGDGVGYQMEMMRCLREVNVDNNTVGWYQSTYLGSYQTTVLIDTFLNYQVSYTGRGLTLYASWPLAERNDEPAQCTNHSSDPLYLFVFDQENIKRCVCLVYDPHRSGQGVLALKALKLTDSFMEVYRAGSVTADALAKGNISWQDIFEEIPISISNSTLHSVLMQEIESDAAANQADFDRLVLSTNPYLEKNLEFLSECLDDLQVEQQKISFYNRNAARQQQQQAQWLQKRRAENFQRRAGGEEPLPEEDINNPIFKALSEPSKLDSLLITNQINNYCNQINK
jgi:translation initiation factor 3 subunit H